jgi:hypothetical protein
MKTIREVSEATGISRFTLQQVAKHGVFGEAAKQSGSTWLLNTEHELFKKWEAAHWQQPRVKGRKSNEKAH